MVCACTTVYHTTFLTTWPVLTAAAWPHLLQLAPPLQAFLQGIIKCIKKGCMHYGSHAKSIKPPGSLAMYCTFFGGQFFTKVKGGSQLCRSGSTTKPRTAKPHTNIYHYTTFTNSIIHQLTIFTNNKMHQNESQSITKI